MDNIDKKSINKNGMAKVVQIPPRIGWKRMGKIMKNYHQRMTMINSWTLFVILHHISIKLNKQWFNQKYLVAWHNSCIVAKLWREPLSEWEREIFVHWEIDENSSRTRDYTQVWESEYKWEREHES